MPLASVATKRRKNDYQTKLGVAGGGVLPEVIPRLLLFGLFALALGGCAARASQPARLGLKLPPAAFGEPVSLQQRLTVERDGRIDQLDAALEVDTQSVDLVVLILDQRMLSLHFDGQALETWRHPMVPAQLQAEDVLENLQLTLWPVDAIRQALPSGWRIEESGLRRTLFLNDAPVMLIEYSSEPRWSGKVVLTDRRYHYLLTIQSVSNGP